MAASTTTWSIVPSPNSGSIEDTLNAVSCISASCTAVGYYYASAQSQSQTLIEQWDGTSWSVAPSPNTSTSQQNTLLGVSCVPASECTAVGSYQASTSVSQTLIEQWNGTAWSIVPSPNAGTTESEI